MNSYYEILSINVTASADEVKRAFRRRAKEIHPDVNLRTDDPVGDMQTLLRAYETLIDPRRRYEYDRRMMLLRPEYRFDYREFLRSRPYDDEFQARLVFFDLLHHHEDDAVKLHDELRARPGFRLHEHLDREDYMDCAYLLAEEYERHGDLMTSFDLLVSTILFETERPYFKHFFVDVTERLRNLVCFQMPVHLPTPNVIECIDAVLDLEIPRKELAFFMKKAAELYADLDDPDAAWSYLRRGLELDQSLPGTKKLIERLDAYHAV